MNTAIIIPARYASTRFPGKPLAEIGGRSMLSRVVELASQAAISFDDVDVFVTTDDQRIADHADEIGAECFITGECETGSDRVLEAAKMSGRDYDFVINLQGDAPFTPVNVVQAILKTAQGQPDLDVITPVHRLSWDDLDRLRENKKSTPFSGTTAVIDSQGYALWFSKNIIPAIRKEDKLRVAGDHSPIFQHIGLYGYRADILERFCALSPSYYEQLEALEQLRFLENGIRIKTVQVDIEAGAIQSGIDTPEDLERANAYLDKKQ